MATTAEKAQQDQEDFNAAFNGAEPERKEISEDEAFGLSPEAAEGDADEPNESEQEVKAEASGEAGAEASEPAVAVVIAPEATDEPTDPKDLQRQKSWEGRLKAKEAELRAREEALKKPAEEVGETNEATEPAEPDEPGETDAQEAGEPAVTEAVEEAAAKVESGELTVDQAIQTLSADFGEDFTKMLGVLIKASASEIANKTADEKVGSVTQKMDGIVSEIVDEKARKHFEAISDAHGDFMDVANSPEFKSFVDNMDETKKADAMQTIESGSSRQIIKLLDSYKATHKAAPADDPAAPAAPAEPDPALDAAEGVRSSGLKLPEQPTKAQDYEAAWDQF